MAQASTAAQTNGIVSARWENWAAGQKETTLVQPRRTRASTRNPYSTKQSSNSGRRIPHIDKIPADVPDRYDILITLHRFEEAGVEIDDRAVEIATKYTRWHHALSEAEREKHQAQMLAARQAQQERECWVYYIRIGRLIKIGMTTNLVSRFTSIRPNEVLFIEPGGAELESEMHRRFASMRAGGEFFHPGPELQAHIKNMRAEFGPPNWTRSLVPDGQDWFPAKAA